MPLKPSYLRPKCVQDALIHTEYWENRTLAQLARIENKLPAYTVGSLLRMIQMETLLQYIERLLQSANPAEQLIRLASLVGEFFALQPSGKHMSGRNLGRLAPTPSLKHRAIA